MTSLADGTVDMVIGALFVTPERAKQVQVSSPAQGASGAAAKLLRAPPACPCPCSCQQAALCPLAQFLEPYYYNATVAIFAPGGAIPGVSERLRVTEPQPCCPVHVVHCPLPAGWLALLRC